MTATGYKPLYIKGMETGLVQSRQEFILPDDAYPILENSFVWRERIKRKQGYQLLGRLRRLLMMVSMGNISAAGAGTFTFNIFTGLGITGEPLAEIEVGSITQITIDIAAPTGQTLTDTLGLGTFSISPPGIITAASINYSTGDLTITFSGAVAASASSFVGAYFPGLPAMGLRSRELNQVNNEMMIAFDTKYAYFFNGGFREFIPGTTWTGSDSNFFWSTNYWTRGLSAQKIFWVTNFSGVSGDPIRYTDGSTWTDFNPQINSAADKLNQCLCILPFRSRLVTFRTLEGPNLATSTQYYQRIRWAAIGSPFTTNAWRDDIRGQGGFLDIPTSEAIISVGFVRDNLVIYCESSTWQLRYTGRSIAPFQIEKVNTELGAEGTFSTVQFDTSLVGVGDKGIVDCDSFKSSRIDIKIPDLVFQFNNNNNGPARVHGIRDFQQRLAFWIYPNKETTADDETSNSVYPDRRLVYNYENESWAIFTDSLTCLGTFQPQSSRRWEDSNFAWEVANFPWSNRPSLFPSIIGGNQQGFIEFLDQQTTNDISLTINDIQGNSPNVTVIESDNHNLQTGQIIQITNIPTGTPFATSLNNGIFYVDRIDEDTFQLWIYDQSTGGFNIAQIDPSGTYIGGGRIRIRDNFRIVSKKFNALDEGQKIQLGYIDVLMDTTDQGAITLNIYIDYKDNQASNTYPENAVEPTDEPDLFFNSVVPTSASVLDVQGASKNWQRVFCPTRANFLTIEWTLSDAQIVGVEQESDVQIDAQILWRRNSGRLGI